MAARSLNQVQLIGNLTRDPEIRYTPSGTAVCTFGVATNRQWVTESGERKEDVEFHRIVAWQKLAEICSKFLSKGRKVYVQGRLQTRSWKGQDGNDRQTTEVVIEDMIILDSRGARDEGGYQKSDVVPAEDASDINELSQQPKPKVPAAKKKVTSASSETRSASGATEDVPPDDIPF
ncbi:single-stranded DNA-binding protein [Candidatus Roizmanbacteria bacterium]|nr:single-stranded DNA-binding protein [Candidatus Roizmanbacteria bacterium]